MIDKTPCGLRHFLSRLDKVKGGCNDPFEARKEHYVYWCCCFMGFILSYGIQIMCHCIFRSSYCPCLWKDISTMALNCEESTVYLICRGTKMIFTNGVEKVFFCSFSVTYLGVLHIFFTCVSSFYSSEFVFFFHSMWVSKVRNFQLLEISTQKIEVSEIDLKISGFFFTNFQLFELRNVLVFFLEEFREFGRNV